MSFYCNEEQRTLLVIPSKINEEISRQSFGQVIEKYRKLTQTNENKKHSSDIILAKNKKRLKQISKRNNKKRNISNHSWNESK